MGTYLDGLYHVVRRKALSSRRGLVAPGRITLALCYVLLNVELGAEDRVLNEVRKIPNVKDCHRVYGVYDMIAKVEAESMDNLKQIVTWKIRRLEGVRSTLTAIAIE